MQWIHREIANVANKKTIDTWSLESHIGLYTFSKTYQLHQSPDHQSRPEWYLCATTILHLLSMKIKNVLEMMSISFHNFHEWNPTLAFYQHSAQQFLPILELAKEASRSKYFFHTTWKCWKKIYDFLNDSRENRTSLIRLNSLNIRSVI